MTKLAVAGNPVFHSLSPFVFSKFTQDNTNKIIKYNRISTPAISDALAFAKEMELDGLNVTAPFKTDVLEFIDKIDYQASNLNSSNTIKFTNNSTTGYNTDYFGILMTIWDNNIILNKQKVLILGAGAAGRTAAFAVRNLNSLVYIWDRNIEKSQRISKEVGVKFIDTNNLINDISSFQYIVSTIPYNSEILEQLKFTDEMVIFDTIYHDSYFKENQSKFGYQLVSGERWLINQAILSHEIFLGRKPKNIPLVQELQKQKKIKHNTFVLIGFSGSGKTSIGFEVAKNLNADFIDIDKMVEQETNLTINQIFEQKGEPYFRQKENDVLVSVLNLLKSSKKTTIISAGGGILTNPDNIQFISKMGFIIWIYSPLTTSLNRIQKANNRPLLTDMGSSIELFNSRKDDYFKYSDAVFLNTSSLDEAVNRLTKELKRLL